LPVDFTRGENTEASALIVTTSLSIGETRALLQEAPQAYRTQIMDILLTALAQAVIRWTGGHSLLVELEGHGRESLFEDVDVSRTVGWFTSIYPVLLELNSQDGPGEALTAVKEQLRGVPEHGIGYGLLRYPPGEASVPAPNIGRELCMLPQPQISFNYLGQFGTSRDDSLFSPAQESRGPERSLLSKRSHLIDINGGVSDRQLRLEWTFSGNLHRRETIEGLAQDFAQSLVALVKHCQNPAAGGVTPSDFPLARLDQKKLGKVLAKLQG
jgi:non-ribosomal peptide synthase protein (TIGR01720 family)